MISYTIDQENKIIFVTLEDETNLKELSLHMEKVLKDKLYEPEMNTLADLGNVLLNFSIQDFPYLKTLLQRHDKIRKNVKWAILKTYGVKRSLIEMILPNLSLSHVKIKIFSDKESAIEWLKEK